MNLAKVVAVHPESGKVDLLVLDDGRRLTGVKVMCALASSSSGVAGLPTPDAQAAADPFNAAIRSDRDLIACVGYYGPVPVVMGFLYPTVTEMLFPDADRYINRTASDVYWTVDGKGNAEFFHPSGAFIRVGETTAHEDLKGKDFNKMFNPKRNASRAVNIHIEQAGGVAKVNIAPNGAVTVDSSVSLAVTTPLSTFNGDIQVNGKINTTGDVVAGTVSLKTHKHGGVASGGSQTGTPV
jgi:phage baseplate assembly protein gpV